MTFILSTLGKEFSFNVNSNGLSGSMSFAGMFFGTLYTVFLPINRPEDGSREGHVSLA